MRILSAALLLSLASCGSDLSDARKTLQQIVEPAGVAIDGKQPWDVQVTNPAFYNRVLGDGTLGLGESYMLGWWDCESIDQLVDRAMRSKLESKIRPSFGMLWNVARAKFFNLQDKVGSLKVIDQHYQLGNDLFQKMLGSTMAYSCGYWKTAKNIDEAQIAKFDLIARKLEMKPGMTVLDIGCGWGGFAKYIAENYGVKVTGITLSENQAEYAREINKGLPVEIRVQDYRDVKESYDRVVEIGMFEHVGVKNHREFLQVVHRVLKDGGLFMLHTIGSNRSSVYGADPWIDKYIFPNAQLPSIAQIATASEGLFVMEDWQNFGADYDKTLMAWHKNFLASWDGIKANYPDPFFRMWNYYLLSCAGSFRAREIQLWQVVLSKGGISGRYDAPR